MLGAKCRCALVAARRPFLRCISSKSAAVGEKLNNLQQLKQFFSKSSWNTKELVNSTSSHSEIDDKMMDGLLDLAGLQKSMGSEERDKLKQSLTDQLQFLDKLHTIEVSPEEQTELMLTRLIDDNCEDDTLDFDALNAEITYSKPNLGKGEVEESWNPLALTKEHDEDYFVVKEGLIKKNKQN